jgi:S1-C subfamily serine protease
MVLDGTIVTNNHVIKGSQSCLVTIPDARTGAPTSIYTASPYSVPGLSELYDIAVLKVTGSYTDTNTKVWGVYPTTFPIFVRPNTCKDEAPKLGDPVRIYGYPVTSGGLNLTITEGIISSFADNGDILTSAKVDSGNSGGLAVNSQTGCMLGIPSAVTLTGNYQNLGIDV